MLTGELSANIRSLPLAVLQKSSSQLLDISDLTTNGRSERLESQSTRRSFSCHLLILPSFTTPQDAVGVACAAPGSHLPSLSRPWPRSSSPAPWLIRSCQASMFAR